MIAYTNIQHNYRKMLQLDLYEYTLLDSIHVLSSNGNNWCNASKKYLADIIDVTDRTVYKIINKLLDEELIIKNEHGELKTTTKYNPYTEKNSVNTLKKIQSDTEKNSYNNNIYNNNNNKSINNNIYNKRFEFFIESYPRQVNQKEFRYKEAKSLFNELSTEEQLKAIDRIKNLKYSEIEYCPYPNNYLKKRIFDNEPEPNKKSISQFSENYSKLVEKLKQQ